MSKITQPSITLLAGLQIKDDIVMEDIMNTVEVGQFSAIHLMDEGLSRLKKVLLDPGKLKIEIPGSPVTVSESEPYYIGAVSGNQIAVPTTWYLNSEQDFQQLKNALQSGYFLFRKVPEGYAIVASKDNVEDMKLTRDMRDYWNDLVAEFINRVIQELTPWYTRPKLKPFSRFIDVDECTTLEDGSIKNNELFLVDIMEELLDGITNQVISFVRKDVMAYMVASTNTRGIQVTRYANAVALKYMIDLENERLMAKQEKNE